MLTLADIIRAPKSAVKIGDWKHGKVPATAFPILRQRTLKLPRSWSWRVIEFDSLGNKFRLLVRLNRETSYYSAILGVEQGALLSVICHHELHITHLGWHCHFVPGNVLDSTPGILRDRNRMRVYEAQPSKAASIEFNVALEDALGLAARRFRFEAPDENNPAQGKLL